MSWSLKATKILLLIFLTAALAPNAMALCDCSKAYGTGSTTIGLATGSPGELGLV